MALFLFFQLAWLFSAAAAPFHGIPHEVLHVRTSDGADLALFHLSGGHEKNAPVVLLEPGLVETAEMLDGIALSFYQRGYEVYIGQVRLAGRGVNTSGKGAQRNGLEEVMLLDFPAHLREVIRRSEGRAIHLLGHSMGGLEIIAAFSDPKLAAEFSPHVKAATLVAAPHDLSGLPWGIRTQSRVMLPVFKTVRRWLGQDRAALAPHHSLFDFTLRMKDSKIPGVRQSAQALENWFIRIGTFILNRTLVSTNHTTPEAMRRLWLKEVSALPLDILIDFAEAATRGGFFARDGRRLVMPEKLLLPVQVIRAQKDMLVPWDKQEGLLELLGSKVKRLISLKGMLHVDPVVADRPLGSFIAAAIDFHDAPEAAAKEQPRLTFNPKTDVCERGLTIR